MRAIVFDLDGTLIDSAPDLHAAAVKMLAGENLPPLGFAQVRGFIGNGVPALVERIMAAARIPQDAATHRRLVAEFLKHYEAAPADRTTLFPEAGAVVTRLKAQGFALGICTNKPEAPSREILRIFGLTEAFEVVIGGDTLDARKPHPAPLRAAFTRLGARAACLYVGDSEVDAETAARAEAPFALFTEGYRKAPVGELAHAYAFAHYREFEAIVAQALPGAVSSGALG